MFGGDSIKLKKFYIRFEMLIGIPPFFHQNQNIMFQLIKEGQVRFPSQVTLSSESKDFILKVCREFFKKYKSDIY